jgi:hypothetical protein
MSQNFERDLNCTLVMTWLKLLTKWIFKEFKLYCNQDFTLKDNH